MAKIYSWLVGKIEYDISRYGPAKIVYAIVRKDKDGCPYQDYYIDIKHVPDRYDQKLYNIDIEKLTLKELYESLLNE